MFYQQNDLGIIKTDNATNGVSKICNNSDTVLNKKYTDATTQHGEKACVYYDQQIQGSRISQSHNICGSRCN